MRIQRSRFVLSFSPFPATVVLWVLVILTIAPACTVKPVAPYEQGPPEAALPAAEDGAFAQIESEIRAQHGPDTSGFKLLDHNTDGLTWRLALIDTAVSSIDIQSYLWYGDNTGRLLMEHLLDAAARGVRIRILVDDLNTLLRDSGTVMLRDRVASWVDAHPNVELRLFNPWKYRELGNRAGEALVDLKRVNQRMHNKAMIVDNRAIIVGGRNLGDEYVGLNTDFNFHDLDVLGVGPVARQTSAIFDSYWNDSRVMPASALEITISREEQAAGRRELRDSLAGESELADFVLESRSWSAEINSMKSDLVPGTSEVHADNPTDTGFDQHMLEEIRSMIKRTQSELLIVNAYIIPIEESISTLHSLSDRGARIVIQTNSLASQDVPAVNSHYRKWRRPIIESGALLFELRHDPAIQSTVVDTPPVESDFVGLHSKAMVVDRRYVYIGSMNFDPRSAEINTEMGVFIDSPQLAVELAALIERDIAPGNSWQVKQDENGRTIWVNDRETVTRQPARSFWQRVQDVIFRIFPKEYY